MGCCMGLAEIEVGLQQAPQGFDASGGQLNTSHIVIVLRFPLAQLLGVLVLLTAIGWCPTGRWTGPSSCTSSNKWSRPHSSFKFAVGKALDSLCKPGLLPTGVPFSSEQNNLF